MVRGIFFDFDGVILDTLEAKGRAFSNLFAQYGKSAQEKVYEYHLENGGLNRIQKLKNCFYFTTGEQISENDLELHLAKLAKEIEHELAQCKLVDGVYEALEQLNIAGIPAWVCSAAPEKEVADLCKQHKIHTFFREIKGYPNKKSESVGQILETEKIDSKACLFIGDAQQDFIAAKENNVRFLLRKTKHSQFAQDYEGKFILDFKNFTSVIEEYV